VLCSPTLSTRQVIVPSTNRQPTTCARAIGRERLREGDQLPSEAQLMAHYRVARMTVRNALRVLEAEGLNGSDLGGGTWT
jgi:DNA-binding GntR family transcriptional regulator